MIPTFNCAGYLRTTLESVLRQDPGPESMHIEVIDDCSTKDDPESVVKEVGGGRVVFYRRPENGGVVANFNTCLNRSRGRLVHILHGDDFVLSGFYAHVGQLAAENPNADWIATRALLVDEQSVILGVTARLRELEEATTDPTPFFYHTPVQTPGIVVRRRFYERHGGFLPQLIHCADCEMWARAIGQAGGVLSSEVLCAYRTFATNDTGRLKRTAENLRDIQRLFAVFAGRYPAFDRRIALEKLSRYALDQADAFRRAGDSEALAHANDFVRKNVPFSIWLKRRFIQSVKQFAS